MTSIYGDHAHLYLGTGWHCPLPLPEGMKYPPPDDTTGNKPYPTENDIADWVEEIPDANLGLRMPRFVLGGDAFEVIGLDVDQYDDKHGYETLRELIDELGPLPMTYRSTSRDPDNPSGIRFFRVLAGQKWKGKPGPDIEVIQRTHRYAVAWPSETDDRVYRWYDLDEQPMDTPPRVDELPALPRDWVEHLCKGEAGQARVIEEIDDAEEALQWLEDEIPGFAEDPSGQMSRATNPEKLAEEMSTGAHDMMVSRLHEVVALAAEGHHGLKIAISRVRKAFLTETLGGADSGEARRDISSARAEWRRALCGEVSKLRADIADDLIRISTVGGYTAADGEIDLEVFRDKMLKRWVERRNTIVDAEEYEDSDSGRAQMFLDALGDAIRPIKTGTDDWAWWDDEIGRLVKLTKAETYGLLWSMSVQASLRATAVKLFAQAELLEEQGSADAEDVAKSAKAYERRAVMAGNRTTIEHSMSMAHVLSKHPIDPADFDTNPLTWGVGNGVLDLRSAADTGIVDDTDSLCRKGKPEDLILQHTPVTYEPGYTHPKWESYLDTFLPDPDYRRYVRKVFGYAFMGGNPQRRIIFIQGGTSTGKTTILEAVQAALGDYSASIDLNGLFRQKRDSGPMPEVINAFPRRVVFASEVGQRNKLHADVIKRLTGGDSVSARALYSNTMIQRTPMFTPIVATNSMPTIEDGDAALWRRLLVLPFDRQVPPSTVEADPIKNSPEALRAVLSWLVDGLLDYLLEGLDENMPAAVRQRQQKFIAGTSSFQMFLDEMTRPAEKGKVITTMLFDLYRQWAKREELRDPLSKREFSGRMRDNGFVARSASVRKKGKVTSIYVYVGIEIAKEA
ncbi:DNA primase/polymerase/helicase [Gordonia phage Commandaria]|uniref:DNA primase/polymerase/helicase n=1 Tax=Gordonia phage Commandaria TaxID=3038364 RepID=A0AAF0GGA6_9CAUD|nr:DNA primase/polymerase/helicase [Gordonia phage Commandaria]WGH20836.1 DNA primase/polymerase/helicase [Gordonia phage Commandaria]